MTKWIRFTVLCIFLLLSSISIASAKGPAADKITVSGPGLNDELYNVSKLNGQSTRANDSHEILQPRDAGGRGLCCKFSWQV